MRKLLFFLLLAGGGYSFYLWYPFAARFPAELAWRAVTRDERGAVRQIEIAVVSGKRWRVESSSPGNPRTLVAVSDGSSATCSIPQAPSAHFDPRPSMQLLLDVCRRSRPEATEQISGRDYLRFGQTKEGVTVQTWADPQTRFPFRIRGGPGPLTETTYTSLPSTVARDTPGLFSLSALSPLLSRYTHSP